MEIYDLSGYSPLHFSSYKNSEKMVEIIIDFVRFIWLFNISGFGKA
jgi:hypothetical protein